MTPKRIQLRRTKGWRKPDGATVVARPSRWGNWWVIKTARELRPNPNYELVDDDALLVVQMGRYRQEGVRLYAGPTMWAARLLATDLYRRSLEATYLDVDGPLNRSWYLDELRGHDLACWCPLDQPCHADVLLELANSEPAP